MSARILHLGLGRFHRGHQAIYYQRMNDLGENWTVASLSMRSPEARDELKAVGLKYPVIELAQGKENITWVHSITEALTATDDRARVLEIFQSKDLEIITLTITEKGYDFELGARADLSHPETPSSAIGLLALGLQKRRLSGLSGLTVISCDNLRGNSKKLKAALKLYFTELKCHDYLEWLERNVSFPCSMVDRIVPALSPEKLNEFQHQFGLENRELIATEVFSQWVIEDHFIHPRPQWEKVGVEFVEDVTPYEDMKLRLLNASHSYLAYEGINRGYQFVHEAVADQELRKNVEALFREVIPTCELPEQHLWAYTQRLVERFQNKRLPHQLRQIAMDGSQKIPQRIFPSINVASASKLSTSMLNQVIASWLDYVYVSLKSGSEVVDPLRDEMAKSIDEGKDAWALRFLSHGLFKEIDGQAITALLRP